MNLPDGSLDPTARPPDANLCSEVLRVVEALPGNGKETIKACLKDRAIERVIAEARQGGDLARWETAGWLRKDIVEMLARQVSDQVVPAKLHSGYQNSTDQGGNRMSYLTIVAKPGSNETAEAPLLWRFLLNNCFFHNRQPESKLTPKILGTMREWGRTYSCLTACREETS